MAHTYSKFYLYLKLASYHSATLHLFKLLSFCFSFRWVGRPKFHYLYANVLILKLLGSDVLIFKCFLAKSWVSLGFRTVFAPEISLLYSKHCIRLSSEYRRLSCRAIVTFGLNALYGRHHIRKGVWGGDWNSSNAHDFIKYTISKGYQIDSWEYGNELSGKGIGASVGADQYGKDLIKLNALIEELYQNGHSKPLILAPGGFYDKQWFAMLLQVSGPHVINVMTHHIYNLGSGVDHNLINKILDPHYLNRISNTYSNLTRTLETDGPWASAWVGESGGAFNSGGHNVSDTFVDSFWYLDQLGMAATYKTKVYCRQTLVGGHYGLLSRYTFVPNPDYYSGLLWHRIMGKGVLNVRSNTLLYLRSYAHCSKGRAGISLLLINLSNQTHFTINVESTMNINLQVKANNKKSSMIHSLKRTVSWIGNKATEEKLYREEYHLAPKDGDLQSKTMLLNGKPLELTVDGKIPIMEPVFLDAHSPISIPPLTIKFVVLPNFDAPGCSF